MSWLLPTSLPNPCLLSLCLFLPVPCSFAGLPSLRLQTLASARCSPPVYVSAGLPAGPSHGLSPTALLSILSLCDWLSWKPVSQQLSGRDSDGCLIPSENPSFHLP